MFWDIEFLNNLIIKTSGERDIWTLIINKKEEESTISMKPYKIYVK